MRTTILTIAIILFTGCTSHQENMVMEERKQMIEGEKSDKIQNESLESQALKGEKDDTEKMKKMN